MTFVIVPALIEAFAKGATVAISVYLLVKEQKEKSK
jgi:hypothetical protein